MDYKDESIGVLGQSGPQRSVTDQRMQKEFGGLNRENFSQDESVGVLGPDGPQRSAMDQRMQKEFNPYYREGYRCPGVASTLDNPNNPYSKYVSYAAIR